MANEGRINCKEKAIEQVWLHCLLEFPCNVIQGLTNSSYIFNPFPGCHPGGREGRGGLPPNSGCLGSGGGITTSFFTYTKSSNARRLYRTSAFTAFDISSIRGRSVVTSCYGVHGETPC